MKPSLSFSDVCKGKQESNQLPNSEVKQDGGSNKGDLQILEISEGGNRKEELKSKLVGELIHLKAVAHIATVMAGEGFHDKILDYLGDMWILISPRTEEEKNKVLNNQNLKSWFKTFKPWDENFKITSRISWISIEGLPVNYWNSDVLVQIGRIWGEVLITDLCQFGKGDISQSRICVRTQITDLIMGSTIVKIEGHIIKIRFVETKADNFLTETITPNKNDQASDQESNDSSEEDSRQGEFSDGESQAPGNRSDSEDEESEYVANTLFGSPETNGNFRYHTTLNADIPDNSIDKSVNNGQKNINIRPIQFDEREKTPNDIPNEQQPPINRNSSFVHPESPNQQIESEKTENLDDEKLKEQGSYERPIPNFYNKISSKLQDLLQTPYNQKRKNVIGEEGEVGKLNGEDQSTRKKLQFSPRITRSKAKLMQKEKSSQQSQGYTWRIKTTSAPSSFEPQEMEKTIETGEQCGFYHYNSNRGSSSQGSKQGESMGQS